MKRRNKSLKGKMKTKTCFVVINDDTIVIQTFRFRSQLEALESLIMKSSNAREMLGEQIKMNENDSATRSLRIRPKSELLIKEELDSSDEEHDGKPKKFRYGVKIPKSYNPVYSSDSDSIPVVDENEFRDFVNVRAKRFDGSEGGKLGEHYCAIYNFDYSTHSCIIAVDTIRYLQPYVPDSHWDEKRSLQS